MITEGDEVAVGEKPPVVGPEIRPPFRVLETGDPSPMCGGYRVPPAVAASGDPVPVVDDGSGRLAVQHVRINKHHGRQVQLLQNWNDLIAESGVAIVEGENCGPVVFPELIDHGGVDNIKALQDPAELASEDGDWRMGPD